MTKEKTIGSYLLCVSDPLGINPWSCKNCKHNYFKKGDTFPPCPPTKGIIKRSKTLEDGRVEEYWMSIPLDKGYCTKWEKENE